jgi:hypothetical protein
MLWFHRQRPARARAGLLLLVIFALGHLARAQNHLWTDQDGHRYDAAPADLFDNQQITFRRPDGSTFTLPLNDLTRDDQQAIHDWFYKLPQNVGEAAPPTQRLSPYGRSFVLDQPRVLRIRPFASKGYASAYLAIPLTLRNDLAGPLDFVNVYIYDIDHKPRAYPIVPPDGPLMIQDGETTAFLRPAEFKVGQTYVVLFPLEDAAARTAAYIVVVAGNKYHPVSIVYPGGSWRDFPLPEHDLLAADKYADFSAQELYPEKSPADLFDIADVLRLRPASDDHSPAHDFFRLSLHTKVTLPATALQADWYAFDKQHHLLHTEGQPPYANPGRTDIFYYITLAGHGPVDISDPVPPTAGDVHTLELPNAAWWDNPDVDSLVFVFGTETKKVARVYSKSGATLVELPVPEKEALGGATPPTLAKIPERTY